MRATTGSPRTGLYPFAKDFSTKMNGNIYRVYHKTDPVPVIPTWPYVHVPQPGTDYLLYSSGDFFNAKYHGMDEYCPKVKGHSWSSLRQGFYVYMFESPSVWNTSLIAFPIQLSPNRC